MADDSPKTDVQYPPFPPLRETEFNWEGECALAAWAGFQSRLGPYASRDSASESDGRAVLYVNWPQDGVSPSAAQRNAFSHLLLGQTTLRAAMLEALLPKYVTWQSDWDPADDAMPPVTDIDGFKPLIGLSTVHMLATEKKRPGVRRLRVRLYVGRRTRPRLHDPRRPRRPNRRRRHRVSRLDRRTGRATRLYRLTRRKRQDNPRSLRTRRPHRLSHAVAPVRRAAFRGTDVSPCFRRTARYNLLMSTAELDRVLALDPAERLDLIGRLWDSLADDGVTPRVTPEQADELHRRLDRFEQQGSCGRSWQDVRCQIERGENPE